MLDYKRWAHRALDFTESLRRLPGRINMQATVRPPLTRSEVMFLSGVLRLPLPAPLSAFLATASSNCCCEYWWEPPDELQGHLERLFPSNTFIFGGASLCDSSQFEINEKGCMDMAEGFERRYPEDARLWVNSVPFHEAGNGDYIALYVGDDRRAQDFPVVYLDHDGCGFSGFISNSFDEFLTAWEGLRYIHGFFLREYYFNPVSGSLNPASPKRAELDALFQKGKDLSHPASR
jgi:hypothetical protein